MPNGISAPSTTGHYSYFYERNIMIDLDTVTSSPTISDNLWDHIMAKKAESRDPKILEYGSGGSTLGFLRSYIRGQKEGGTMELVSFEHWPGFYDYMCGRIADLLSAEAGRHDARFTVYRLSGPRRAFSEVIRDTPRAVFSVPAVYDILSTRKTRLLDPVRFAVMALDRANKKACHLLNMMKALVRFYRTSPSNRSSGAWERERVARDLPFSEFKEFLVAKRRPEKCETVITCDSGRLTVRYYLLPQAGDWLFWRRRDIDGTFDEFEDYVTFPLETGFTVAYLDGRSRVPAARRVVAEKLLAAGGYLFMHDAYKEWYKKGLPDLYREGKTMDGSNKGTNGRILLEKFAASSGDPVPAKEELLIWRRAT